MRIRKSIVAISLIAAIFAINIFFSNTSYATSTVGFEAGNIIDSVVFTNTESMTVEQIQTFLNSKVPSCDTWHEGFYGASGTWYGPPFVCLKDYSENSKTAAQIIYDASQTYKINPQVLIVLLQKEQSLITDTWPASFQYKTATGYGCPDTAACDANYYGFTNQVNNAAKMFRAILNDSPTWYTPYELGNNYIQYNPDSGCGGTTVNIQNRATQALYNYTPYQPNAAALAAGYGAGDYCSAYGNRNFYLYFTDWFGSTKDRFGYSFLQLSSSLTVDSGSLFQNKEQNFTYTVTNNSDFSVALGEAFVMVRGPQGQNLDISSDKNIVIAAHGTYTFSKKWSTPYIGEHTFKVIFYKQNVGYTTVSPESLNSSIIRSFITNVKPSLRITSSLSVSPETPVQGNAYTATFTVRNDSNQSVDIGYPFVIVRGPQGQNLDVGIDSSSRIVIAANGTYNYSKQWTTSASGAHSMSIAFWVPEKNSMLSIPTDNGITKTLSVNFKPSVRVTSSLTINPEQPIQGENYTATFSIRNDSDQPVDIGYPFVSVRGPQGQNLDIGIDNSSRIVIAANSTYNYSKQWLASVSGLYSMYITSWMPEKSVLWNIPADTGVNRTANVTVKPSLRITSSLSVSPETPVQGNAYTATFTVRNDSNQSVDIGYPFVIVRGPQGQNLDVGIDSSSRIVIAANGTYNYSKQWTTSASGAHSMSIAFWVPEKNSMLSIPTDNGITKTLSVNFKPSVRVTSSLTINPEQPIQGENYTATFSIRNDSDQPVDIGYPFVSVRGPQGQNLDIGIDNSSRIVIAANSTYNYSKQWLASVSGLYSMYITSWMPEKSVLWNIPADTGVNRTANVTVKPK